MVVIIIMIKQNIDQVLNSQQKAPSSNYVWESRFCNNGTKIYNTLSNLDNLEPTILKIVLQRFVSIESKMNVSDFNVNRSITHVEILKCTLLRLYIKVYTCHQSYYLSTMYVEFAHAISVICAFTMEFYYEQIFNQWLTYLT